MVTGGECNESCSPSTSTPTTQNFFIPWYLNLYKICYANFVISQTTSLILPISTLCNISCRFILTFNRSAVGGIALTLAYGLPIQPHDDPYIALVEETLHEINKAGFPGTYLVDLFPLLKHVPAWIPGAGFQKVAERNRALNKRFKDEPFEA